MLRNLVRIGLIALAAPLVLVVASWHPTNFGLSQMPRGDNSYNSTCFMPSPPTPVAPDLTEAAIIAAALVAATLFLRSHLQMRVNPGGQAANVDGMYGATLSIPAGTWTYPVPVVRRERGRAHRRLKRLQL